MSESRISRKREDLTAEYGRAQKAHSDACREIEGKRSALRTKNASLAGDRNVLQAQIEHLKESLTAPKASALSADKASILKITQKTR